MLRLLSVREAAQTLGFRTTKGFLRWCNREGLPVIRISRKMILVDQDEFERFVIARKMGDRKGPKGTERDHEDNKG